MPIIRDFAASDLNFFLEQSEKFYNSDAVEMENSSENFRNTFELCVEGSPYLRGIIIMYGGKTAGYALLSFTYSNEAGGICVLMEEIMILPEYQGLGIGSKFIELVEEEYINKCGARRFRLEVAAANPRAVALYERLGFKKIDYIQMCKDIDCKGRIN